MNKYDIAILGGDKRTLFMAPIFHKKGYRTICFGTAPLSETDHGFFTEITASSLEEAVENAPIIICGIPMEKENCLYCTDPQVKISVTALKRALRKHQSVYGGNISASFRSHCAEREIQCFDFLQDERTSLLNATATAEGAVLEALLHKETLLYKSSCLVLGYGRCGKLICEKLKGLGCHVTVFSTSHEELAWAYHYRLDTVNPLQLDEQLDKFDYLFNTIPACILNRDRLLKTKTDALIIDIASDRLGADYTAAQTIHRIPLFCPGLPGKYASESCAAFLTDFVIANNPLLQQHAEKGRSET